MELLSTLEEVDPNLPDKDGNTPLIFAAQAGICFSMYITAVFCGITIEHVNRHKFKEICVIVSVILPKLHSDALMS